VLDIPSWTRAPLPPVPECRLPEMGFRIATVLLLLASLMFVALLGLGPVWQRRPGGVSHLCPPRSTQMMGHHSDLMAADEPCDFARCCDLVLTASRKVANTTRTPARSVYIKTDYLPTHVDEILSLTDPFVLFSACSDFSPFVHFPAETEKILAHAPLDAWYMENRTAHHPKARSLSVGLATHTAHYEMTLRNLWTSGLPWNLRDETPVACWRMREANQCGSEYIERPAAAQLVKSNPDKFCELDVALSENGETGRIYTASRYAAHKFVLCPLGNGIDPSPRLLECLLLGSVPICVRHNHSFSCYGGNRVAWIEEWTMEAVAQAMRDFPLGPTAKEVEEAWRSWRQDAVFDQCMRDAAGSTPRQA